LDFRSREAIHPKAYAAEYFLRKTREVIAAVPEQRFPDEESLNAGYGGIYRKSGGNLQWFDEYDK